MLLAGGVVAGTVLLLQMGSWWASRSYVPVAATVRGAHLQFSHSSGRGRHRTPPTVTGVQVDYAYRFGGRDYQGRDISTGSGLDNTRRFRLGGTLSPEDGPSRPIRITVWVDPAAPQTSILSRDFRWPTALMTFMVAAILGAAALFTLSSDGGRMVPVSDRLVPADRGRECYLGWYAGCWNVLAFPLALLAAAHIVQEVKLVYVVALLLCVGGMALAAAAWRLAEQRWVIGSAQLERVNDTLIGLKARIHFDPGLGLRFAPSGADIRVGIEIRQVYQVKRGAKVLRETVWRKQLDEFDVQQGTRSFEISTEAPPWRQGRYDDSPLYWKVVVHVHDRALQFRLKPQFRLAAPASRI
jgi:hypothetical protein